MLNTAVENRIVPKLGTVERQRRTGSPGRYRGVGMPTVAEGSEAAVTEGWKPHSAPGGHGDPRGCAHREDKAAIWTALLMQCR